MIRGLAFFSTCKFFAVAVGELVLFRALRGCNEKERKVNRVSPVCTTVSLRGGKNF